MNILLIVNESPWGSTLANTALRFARAALEEGMNLRGVYFRGDGVYNALQGRATDSGAQDLSAAWSAIAGEHGVALMLCSAAATRRLPAAVPGPYREAGLAELFEMMSLSDRVVAF